jgi:hypothetical protein
VGDPQRIWRVGPEQGRGDSTDGIRVKRGLVRETGNVPPEGARGQRSLLGTFLPFCFQFHTALQEHR